MKLLLCLCMILTIAGATVTTTSHSLSKQYIECKEFTHPRCLKWNNKTQSCFIIDCWTYDSLNGCEKSGKPWLPAIILQSIPFTGTFGSGFGNIGRWDIFAVYMGIVFGPIALVCIIACCVTMYTKEDVSSILQCFTACFACLYVITVVGFWIWGIIQIAGKAIEAPWTNYAGEPIMCPMV